MEGSVICRSVFRFVQLSPSHVGWFLSRNDFFGFSERTFTSGKRAKGCWPIWPLVPVFLQTGTKGCINTGFETQAYNTGSSGIFSTGFLHKPVLKEFLPILPLRWGLCWTFSTGLLCKPVLEGVHPSYFISPTRSILHFFISKHISKINLSSHTLTNLHFSPTFC